MCEWVPWHSITTRFGETEAARRLLKGTIVFKPDETDPEEHVFKMIRVIDRQYIQLCINYNKIKVGLEKGCTLYYI